jgi:organic radical activating enzyme
MKPLFSSLSMMVTYQCNIECKHCGPYCGPREYDWMSIEEMKSLARQAGELGAYNVVFTGGEPTLMKDKLITLLQYIKSETLLKSTRIVTNAKWASSYKTAYEKLAQWKDAGLDEVNISCGEYHQEFVPVQYVANAYKAACDLNYDTVLMAGEFIKEGKGKLSPKDFIDAVGEKMLPPHFKSPYVSQTHGMSCGAAMAYGRGKLFITEEDMIYQDRKEMLSLCADVNSVITVHPNGNTTACCGIMVRDESLLNIGNWREENLEQIVKNAQQDIILNWIRHLGLKDMQEWLKKKDPSLVFPDKYVSICDLCAQLLYNKRCQQLLMEQGHERHDDIIANKLAQDATIYSSNFQYADSIQHQARV